MCNTKIPLKRKLEIIGKTALGPGKPRWASLFITRKCNLNCSYCRSIGHKFRDLSFDQWRPVIDRLHAWGVRIFSLTGGEPIMRKDIGSIVQYLSSAKKSISWLISNFKLMNRDKIDMLSESGLNFLTCSIDSFSDGDKQVEYPVLELLEYAKSRGIICSTLSVITRNNIEEVRRIAEEVTGRGIIFDMNLFHHVGGIFSSDDDFLKAKDLKALEGLRGFLKRQKLKNGLIAPSWSYLSEDLRGYIDMSWKCSSKDDNFLVVNNDGRLMPCQEYLSEISVLEIDSLKDKKWREAKNRMVESCTGCFYGCYYQKEKSGLFDVALGLYTLMRV